MGVKKTPRELKYINSFIKLPRVRLNGTIKQLKEFKMISIRC